MAYETLEGFGDSNLGEWTEDRPKAFHVRRRLTPVEQKRVGDAIDIRKTEEELNRMKTLLRDLPEPVRTMVAASFEAQQ